MFSSGASLLRNEHHKRARQLGDEELFDEILRRRYVALQYDDDGSDDDSGSGDIASQLSQSALSLGSSYLTSQLQPTTTQSPQVIRPPAATGAIGSSSTVLILVVVLVIAVIGIFAFSKA